jgi:hypothetical protein
MTLARGVEFEKTAVTDDPVPADVKKLNPPFGIAVNYRASKYLVKPSPKEGGIVAKVAIKGVPTDRGVPDGEYFLWVGGPDESMRATMVKVDGSLKKDLDVLSEPSLAEEAVAHSPRVHIVVEQLAAVSSAALPIPGTPPRPPPPPPKPRSFEVTRRFRHTAIDRSRGLSASIPGFPHTPSAATSQGPPHASGPGFTRGVGQISIGNPGSNYNRHRHRRVGRTHLDAMRRSKK